MPSSSHPDCPALLALTRHTAARLEAMSAPLLSAQTNWTINRQLGCTCGDCYIAQVEVEEGRQEQRMVLIGWLSAWFLLASAAGMPTPRLSSWRHLEPQPYLPLPTAELPGSSHETS